MTTKTITRIIGIIVLALGIGGLFAANTQLFNSMNTDMPLTSLRIILGLMLLISTFMGLREEKIALGIFGIVYLANFFAALVSPTMFNLLPHTFGMLDNTIHLVGGVIGLLLAFWPAPRPQTRHAV